MTKSVLRIVLCSCLLLWSQSSLIAQWRGLRLHEIGPELGLNMQVNDIVQDSSGYMYFAGSGGLIRYDGENLVRYTHIPGDSSSIGVGEINQIVFGSDGLIWMAMEHEGVNSINPKTLEVKKYELLQKSALSSNAAFSIFEDEQHDLWVGANELRLFRLNRSIDTFEIFTPGWFVSGETAGKYAIENIYQDHAKEDQFLLTVTDHQHPVSKERYHGYGNIIFNKKTKTFASLPIQGKLIHQDKNGELFFWQQNESVKTIDPKNKNVNQFHEAKNWPIDLNQLQGITNSGKEKYILTQNEISLIREDGQLTTIYQNTDKTNPFQGFQLQDSENLWMSTNHGLKVFHQQMNHFQFFSLSDFGEDEIIYPGRLDYDPKSGAIYLSSSYGKWQKRIYKIPLENKGKDVVTYFDAAHRIEGISVDNKKRVWLFGHGNFYNLKQDKLSPVEINAEQREIINHSWVMQKTKSGTLVLAGKPGLQWLDPDTKILRSIRATDFSWPEHRIEPPWVLEKTSIRNEEQVFVLTQDIHSVDLNSGLITPIKLDINFNRTQSSIPDILEDKQGRIWLAGPMHFGKYKLNQDSLILEKNYGIQEGLVDNLVYKIHEDHRGRIWCFTFNGLSCLDPESDEIRNFSVPEGLPDPYCKPYKVINLPDQRIATVNSNGLLVFHPDKVWDIHSPQKTNVVINSLLVNGSAYLHQFIPNEIKNISLSRKEVLDISFQGLVFPDASQVRYSYRLLGLQDEWVDLGKNKTVTLAGLSPGTYNFQVKAGVTNSDAVPKSLEILVPAAFYQKAWFPWLIVLMTAGLSYGIYRNRIISIRKEEEKKTEQNKKMAELELKALRSQMNPHFMFNSLNSIKNFILKSESYLAAEYLSDFSHLIRLILQNSREKLIALDDELETLRLYIDLEQLRFDHSFHFDLQIDKEINLSEIQLPPLIMQPFVENAIWHGLIHKKENGILKLHIKKDATGICCVIEDNGIGRKKALALKSNDANKYKSMGMGITMDRIALINSLDTLGISAEVIDLHNISGEANGTRVLIKIPTIFEK